MVNDTEAKYALSDVRSNRFDVLRSTSELFKPPAVTDYEKKEAEEKARIHERIKQISDAEDYINGYKV